ncbi:MAG: sugar phosphate nucleotidyltransferase [Candidatus Magasanikbacteria bacterium]
MNAIILCGGLSTRLGDITKEIPKILLEIGKKKILDWQLEKLKPLGVKEVVLAAGHLADELYREVGVQRMGMEMIYAIEDKKLGTGGAIKHGMEYLRNPDEPVFVLNGDILYTIDFADMAEKLKPETDGIILGTRVEDASTYGTLEYDSQFRLKSFKEKEGKEDVGYINGGLYLLTKHFKKYFPGEDSFSIEYDVFPHTKDLYVYKSDRTWIDVGVPERLEWARGNWELFNNN